MTVAGGAGTIPGTGGDGPSSTDPLVTGIDAEAGELEVNLAVCMVLRIGSAAITVAGRADERVFGAFVLGMTADRVRHDVAGTAESGS